MGCQCCCCLVYLEFNRTVQQPIPVYGFVRFQLVVDNYNVGMQQEDMTAILLKWSFSETVFARLFKIVVGKVPLPHGVFTDATIGVGGISQGIGYMLSVEHTHNVSIGTCGERLPDTVY